MKFFFTFTILFLSFLQNQFAQSKPDLPIDFFDKFSYTLPENFNYNDSVQLRNEIVKINTALLQLQKEAVTDFEIRDTTRLYYFLDNDLFLNAVAGNHTKTVEDINMARSLRPSPNYQAPFRMMQLAYSRAVLLHADDGSDAFKSAFTKVLNEEYLKIDPDFRSDVINQQKGGYTAAAIQNDWLYISRALDQSIKSMKGKLNSSNAVWLMKDYLSYSVRKKYQPLIEASLYAVDPSKVTEENVKIPMRDGIKLNAYVYKDITNTSKLPAIVSLSPYPSGGEATKGNVFATNGYIYVYVDNRGRRKSEGVFMPYENDAQDYYDIIDWISKQPWCDGQVATSGGSYLGFVQWQAIRKEYRHPALKAINPMVAVGFGIDFPRISNKLYPYILQWATFVSGKELNEPLFSDYQFWDGKGYELYKNRIPFAKLDSVVGMPNPIFQKWVSHPDFDNYYKDILPKKIDYATLDIPVFTITGYYDDDQLGAMYYYNEHHKYASQKGKDNHYLLIGPYNHGGSQWQPGPVQNGINIETEAQIPIYKYVIWWFDWVLKGKQKPSFIKDNITYFATGDHQWKGTSSFKKLTTDSLVLYLNPAIVSNPKKKDLHSLSENKPVKDQSLTYKHDIAMALDSAYLFAYPKPFDDSLYMTSPYNMVFESEPLEKDLMISDKILAHLYLTLNVPDADFDISIDEVDAEGKNRTLGKSETRLRYRNGGDKPQLLRKGEVASVVFNDIFIYIKKVSKGSKLRLTFHSTNHPWSEKNFGFGGEVSKETTTSPRIINATILMNKKYPSRVVIPYTSK